MAKCFDDLLSSVYSWWPAIIDRSNFSATRSLDFEEFYELKIAPAAFATGSRLLIQLDWIVYAAVCQSLKVADVVRIAELRKDNIEMQFNKLLLTIGCRQLNGDEEPDGSFDLAELALYLKNSGLEDEVRRVP